MTRPEQRLWDIQIEQPGAELAAPDFDVKGEARELGNFLDGEPITRMNIDFVIPSTRFGIIFRMTLGRIIGEDIPEDEDVEVNADIFTLDNRVLACLENGLYGDAAVADEETRDALVRIRKNVYLVKNHIENPFNWPEPFNPTKQIDEDSEPEPIFS